MSVQVVLTTNGEPAEASFAQVQAQVASAPQAEPTSEAELETLVDDVVQRGQLLKATEPVCVRHGTGQLSQFSFQFVLHALPLPVPPRECLIRLRQRVDRKDQLEAPRCSQTDYLFAAGILLLKQGQFQDKVRLHVDVHTLTA